MVPTPTSLSTPTPATEVNSSGAEEPAAMKVAPATSSDKSNFSEIASRDGTKKSSHIRASPAGPGLAMDRVGGGGEGGCEERVLFNMCNYLGKCLIKGT